MEIKENEQFNVITDNSKVNINLLKQLDTLQKENEGLKRDLKLEKEINSDSCDVRFRLVEENTKLKEALKDIRSQLFDSKNCETILTKSIDGLLND